LKKSTLIRFSKENHLISALSLEFFPQLNG